MTNPFRQTQVLFSVLCRVESATELYCRHLDRVQGEIAGRDRAPSFEYVPPSSSDDSEEDRSLDEEIRNHIPSIYSGLVRLFDLYHQHEVDLRAAIERGKLAAGEAAGEIDGTLRISPMDRKSAQIRLALQNLGGAVPAPLFHGYYPPTDPMVTKVVGECLVEISHWINRLRVLFKPSPLPVLESAEDPTITTHQGDQTPKQGPSELAGPDGAHTPAPSGADATTDLHQPWRAGDDGKLPLRGWADICASLGVPSDRNVNRRLRRLNDQTTGPIQYCGNRPEVNEGQLRAWIRDVDGRAEATENARAQKAAMIKDLSTGGVPRQRDFSLHPESRPNARGKARPAPPTP